VIDDDAVARGHRYLMHYVNAYCPKCSYRDGPGFFWIALTCDFDDLSDATDPWEPSDRWIGA